jgi:hypothetical protein
MSCRSFREALLVSKSLVTKMEMSDNFLNSSAIRGVRYDQATKTLEIKFQDGTIYEYVRVPESMHVGLMSAESKGQYFDREIKHGGYSYERVL